MNVFFHTFGCKANQYDTDVVRQAFADRGATVVEDPAQADVAVINSCTVTAASEQKLRSFVRRLGRRSALRTVVIGCAAALDDGTIAALPSVRSVVGGADTAGVLRAAGISPEFPLSTTSSPPGPLSTAWRGGTQGRTRAWLRIQDGCDEHCTFCATTLARGANRSRSIPELVDEAKILGGSHAEIVLTGIHIGTYGQDATAHSAPRTLATLLEALISAVPVVRFRLSSIEATEVDDTIARLLIEAPRHLAAHIHAPLQSGANRILKRMGRHWYTAESYRARLEWLAERLPVFGLGADVIAGFPGETEAEHQVTLALIDGLPFTYLHVFPFSVRPDAPAARLGDAVAPPVIARRARELREMGERKAAAHQGRRSGATADGVVTGRRQGQVEVLTEDYLSVYLPVDSWDGRARLPVTV